MDLNRAFSADLISALASVQDDRIRAELIGLWTADDEGRQRELLQQVAEFRQSHDAQSRFLSTGAAAMGLAETPGDVSVLSTSVSHGEVSEEARAQPVSDDSLGIDRERRGRRHLEQPGSTLSGGKYRLVKFLGEGGMGSVWQARQEYPLQRDVAIKWIRSDRISPTSLIRFDIERQSLARMQHASIAKVFDADRDESGRPYFVMEWVHGQTLTTYCRERQASLRERLELCLAIASAIDHAHRKGILHRDLKPANVLVAIEDGKPIPKVIDFGLAKALSESEDQLVSRDATAQDQIVGTPIYMAPEQIRGGKDDVDTRADVHALGLILHELLIGRTPIDANQFSKASWSEKFRMIEHESHETPSSRLIGSSENENHAATLGMKLAELRRCLRGDLDAIMSKSLEKDRELRYGSAAAMAEDIRRYLKGFPIQASPRSRLYVLRKWIGRHRVASASGLVALIAVVFGVVGSWLFAIDARQARNTAKSNEAIARQQSEIALSTMISIVNGLDLELATIPRAQKTRQRILEVTLSQLEKIADELVSQEVLDEAAIVTMVRLADLLLDIGQADRDRDRNESMADSEFRSSLDLTVKLLSVAILSCRLQLETDPKSVSFLSKLSSGLFSLGEANARLGRNPESLASFQEALELNEKLRVLDPGNVQWELNDANAATRIGDQLIRQGDLSAGVSHYERALSTCRELAEADPENQTVLLLLALAIEKRGDVAQAQNDLDGALSRFDESHQIYSRLASQLGFEREAVRGQAILASKRGDIRLSRDELAAAQASYQEGLDLLDPLWQSNPDDYWLGLDRSLLLERLGDLEIRRGDIPAAFVRFESLLETDRQRLVSAPDDIRLMRSLSVTLIKIGDLLRQDGSLEDALSLFSESRELRERLFELTEGDYQSKVDLAVAESRIGETFLLLQDWENAQAALQRSLLIREELAAQFPDQPGSLELLQLIHVQLSDLESRQGNAEQAMKHAQQSLTYLEKRMVGGNDRSLERDLSVAYDRVGSAALELGQVELAIEHFQKAMEIDQRRAEAAPDDVRAQLDLMASYYRIASVAETSEDWTVSLEAYDNAIAIAQRLIEAGLAVEEANARLDSLREMRQRVEKSMQ